MSQKSYDGKATLFLISTPIGNLDDITLRAINSLKEVKVIFSEDTRVTRQLLNHLNIKKKLISNHQYNEKENKEKIIEYLQKGENVGLVTDRGTPIISDPGYELTKHVIANGYNVVAISGITALIPALITSGIDPQPFTFYGFLNSKKNKRLQELKELKSLRSTLIFYESPHRLTETLTDMLNIFGDRNISVSREITKKFEEIYRGKISDIISETLEVKGEIVIITEGNTSINNYDQLSIIEHVNLYIKEGLDSREAIKKVAKDRNLPKNKIYKIYHAGE